MVPIGLQWAGRLAFVLVAVLAVSWVLQRDAQQASASHTEILVSDLYTSAHRIDSDVVMIGGAPKSYYIWSKNVDNTTGTSAFDIIMHYNPSVAGLTTILTSTTWLESTGRQAYCDTTELDPINGEGFAGCTTFLPPPPYGPMCPSKCNGWLATFIVNPGDDPGTTTFNLGGSALWDTPPNPDNVAQIPALVRNLVVIVAPCADFPTPNYDGTVRIADILYVVERYRSPLPEDQEADLDQDGLILVQDILIAVKEFFQDCPV